MSSETPSKPKDARAERLKAALKANLGRRKTQARVRSAKQAGDKAPSEKE